MRRYPCSARVVSMSERTTNGAGGAAPSDVQSLTAPARMGLSPAALALVCSSANQREISAALRSQIASSSRPCWARTSAACCRYTRRPATTTSATMQANTAMGTARPRAGGRGRAAAGGEPAVTGSSSLSPDSRRPRDPPLGLCGRALLASASAPTAPAPLLSALHQQDMSAQGAAGELHRITQRAHEVDAAAAALRSLRHADRRGVDATAAVHDLHRHLVVVAEEPHADVVVS